MKVVLSLTRHPLPPLVLRRRRPVIHIVTTQTWGSAPSRRSIAQEGARALRCQDRLSRHDSFVAGCGGGGGGGGRGARAAGLLQDLDVVGGCGGV